MERHSHTEQQPNLVLSGFMGTGKSTVGRIVAERLNMEFADSDTQIEADAGMAVSEIFRIHGEPAFREMEHGVCKRLSRQHNLVIATGGGALLNPDSRAALEKSGVIILLTCEEDILLQRLQESARRGERPLLRHGLEATIASILQQRKPVYSTIALKVDTTHLTPEQAADEVLQLYYLAVNGQKQKMTPTGTHLIIQVKSPTNTYNIHYGYDLLDGIGAITAPLDLGRKVVIATDSNVAALYGDRVADSLRAAGRDPHIVAMPAGEEYKVWDSVALFIDGFIEAGLDRTGWVLALGGGVVGDTAGFAAATFMRGVRLVQVPTTLLSMADSSVGGKVGVDHPSGKNLLGAFKQPDRVIADLDTLATLPPLQIACGMAEIIKAGIIADPELFEIIERSSPGSIDYHSVLGRAIVVKRDIVQADPYETTGKRALLNLGHTFGHAFESCTDYARPHGVAVAQGMAVAFDLATTMGLCASSDAERVRAVLENWNLPVSWGSPDLEDAGAPERVYSAMLLDKKRRDGHLRLVLPNGIGKVSVVEDVPRELILERLVALQ